MASVNFTSSFISSILGTLPGPAPRYRIRSPDSPQTLHPDDEPGRRNFYVRDYIKAASARDRRSRTSGAAPPAKRGARFAVAGSPPTEERPAHGVTGGMSLDTSVPQGKGI